MAALDTAWEAQRNTKPRDFEASKTNGLGSADDDVTGRVGGHGTQIISGESITLRQVGWRWEGYLANGKMHLLAGAVTTGKTTIAINLGATISSRGKWPDGTASGEPADILIWSGEDDAEDTLLPRFVAAGGVRDRFKLVKAQMEKGKPRAFDPSTDMQSLAVAAESLSNLGMFIVDPVILAVSGDSHKNAEVRRGMQPIADFCAARNCPGLGITHFTKGTAGRDPIERVTGSLAFTAGPRIVLVAAKPNDTGKKLRLVRVKSNIGPQGDGFEYDLIQDLLPAPWDFPAQRVMWRAPLFGQARNLLEDVERATDFKGATKEEMAGAFLHDLLANGPVPTTQIQTDSKAAGLAWRTVQRAAKELGIITGRVGGIGSGGGWNWHLPDEGASNA
jgi:putative DNA primase/helicase